MITATTAPARLPVNGLKLIQIIGGLGDKLVMTIQCQDSNGNALSRLLVTATDSDSQAIAYDAGGEPSVVTPQAPITGVSSGVYTTLFTASGGKPARFNAAETYLQSRGVLPL